MKEIDTKYLEQIKDELGAHEVKTNQKIQDLNQTITNDLRPIQGEVGRVTDELKNLTASIPHLSSSIETRIGDDICNKLDAHKVEKKLRAQEVNQKTTYDLRRIEDEVDRVTRELTDLKASLSSSIETRLRDDIRTHLDAHKVRTKQKMHESNQKTTDDIRHIQDELCRVTGEIRDMKASLPHLSSIETRFSENLNDIRGRLDAFKTKTKRMMQEADQRLKENCRRIKDEIRCREEAPPPTFKLVEIGVVKDIADLRRRLDALKERTKQQEALLAEITRERRGFSTGLWFRRRS